MLLGRVRFYQGSHHISIKSSFAFLPSLKHSPHLFLLVLPLTIILPITFSYKLSNITRRSKDVLSNSWRSLKALQYLQAEVVKWHFATQAVHIMQMICFYNEHLQCVDKNLFVAAECCMGSWRKSDPSSRHPS